ncbi:MAG TPA: HlyD family efflux transporter periplasmic adaptor subunit [Solirubrobacteraceae bacterium]|nr:HlyD family efflux transporter periplasmic adaptor subunit [Solirubrobacteraceae bacterium]
MTIRISWPALGLALAVAALAVAAALEVGPPTASARTAREVVTAQDGIVQSTVTATGNVEPATDVTVGFQTSGVLQALDVKLGQHVDAGQLLATLDPTAAQLTVDQAQENLAAAEDQLANAENLQSQASSSSASTSASAAASDPPRSGGGAGSSSRGSSTRSSGSSAGGSSAGGSAAGGSSAGGSAAGGSSAGGSAAGGSSGSGSAESADSLAAGVASAQAAVDGAEAALRTAENELSETRLFAPVSGTVVSLADIAPGQVVSATSGLGSGSGSGTGASATSRSSATSGSASGASGSGASGSSSSSGSGSSGLVEIASTRSLVMTVSLSEADISQVHVGDNATVTIDALTGVELPARLTSISPLGTSSSGVVTYDATLTLTATDPQVRPGMSASASIITAQASGVNLPSAAVSATSGSVAHVEVLDGSREVSTPVVVGLVGDTRTQIVSGLRAGQQVVVTETLPSLSATPTSSASPLGGGLGGFGGLGGLGIGRALRRGGAALGGGLGGG